MSDFGDDDVGQCYKVMKPGTFTVEKLFVFIFIYFFVFVFSSLATHFALKFNKLIDLMSLG